MSLPSEDTQVKAASEGAQAFIETYYEAINRSQPLDPFYTTSSKPYTTASRPADISINGTVLAQPTDYEALLKQQGRDCRYEVESFDAHAVNPHFALAAPDAQLQGGPDRTGQKMSLLVQVTGRVEYGKSRDAPRRPFNEVFVLVPNWEAMGKNAPRGLKRWLILSQNFRTL